MRSAGLIMVVVVMMMIVIMVTMIIKNILLIEGNSNSDGKKITSWEKHPRMLKSTVNQETAAKALHGVKCISRHASIGDGS